MAQSVGFVFIKRNKRNTCEMRCTHSHKVTHTHTHRLKHKQDLRTQKHHNNKQCKSWQSNMSRIRLKNAGVSFCLPIYIYTLFVATTE